VCADCYNDAGADSLPHCDSVFVRKPELHAIKSVRQTCGEDVRRQLFDAGRVTVLIEVAAKQGKGCGVADPSHPLDPETLRAKGPWPVTCGPQSEPLARKWAFQQSKHAVSLAEPSCKGSIVAWGARRLR
jgi:hypothetical protein